MSIRKLAAVALAWALSLVGVGLWAQGAQGGAVKPPRTIETGKLIGDIITGENIGFQRIASTSERSGQVTGRIMVKIDGEWREVVPAPGIVRVR